LNKALPNILDNSDEYTIAVEINDQVSNSAQVAQHENKVLKPFGFINLQPQTPATLPQFNAKFCETQRYHNFLSISMSNTEAPYQLHENDDDVVLRVDVPGFSQEDLDQTLFVSVNEEGSGFFFQIEAEKIDACANFIDLKKSNSTTRKISQCTNIVPMTKYSTKCEKQIENGILTLKMQKPKLICL